MILVIALSLFLAPTAVSQEFVTIAPPETLTVREKVNEAAGTMSGSHRARIRANSLIASLFLSESGQDTVVKPGKLKLAPITLPKAIKDNGQAVRLCGHLNTVNGHYTLISSDPLDLEAEGESQALTEVEFKTEHEDILTGRYSDRSFIGRSYLAERCAGNQSSYFVPVSFSDNPTELNITFEVVDGTVAAKFYLMTVQGRISRSDALMECRGTRRITSGYDCTIQFSALDTALKGFDYLGLIEIHLTIKSGHDESNFRTRVSVPLP